MLKKVTQKRTELQRLLSKRGLASRSKASILIREGKVKVNGKTVKDPLAYISIDSQVSIDGIEVNKLQTDKKILIAFHKPKGVVTTSSDEKGRGTVYDLLPEKYRDLKAIGRLDMATSGLLLFTNDNQFANDLLDPKNNIPRTYIVTVKGEPSKTSLEKLTKGIICENIKLIAKEVAVRKSSGKETILVITLQQGKNREIRKLCEAIGHEVIKLKRISFGKYQLDELAVGAVKELKF
jgi:23S rRNA pseudouridine2605 synthase